MKALGFVMGCVVILAARAALACGGGWGDELVIEPKQEIVVVHKAGVETYVFNPSFCGRAANFGLVLPVPAPLSSDPSLLDAEIFSSLAAFTAPEIVYEDQCYYAESGGCGGSLDTLGGDGGGDEGTGGGFGASVLDMGQVGIFDWTLLHATTPAAFTDWLDTNGYPYQPAATVHFNYYVAVDWYFVAFRVTAYDGTVDPDYDICGDFGPISLQFPAATPVIPARITAADDSAEQEKNWVVYAIADDEMRLVDSADYFSQRTFSGVVSTADLTSFSHLGDVAGAGDRVTTLEVEFSGADLEDDILLEVEPNAADFRDVEYRDNWVECSSGPCAGVDSHGVTSALLGGILALAIGRIRKRWRRRDE